MERRCLMLGLPPEIVVFDCEWTAWEGSLQRKWSGSGERRELVQIGAAIVRTDTGDFSELDTFVILVKPNINPALSEYFINLTGITQEEVDHNGIPFSEALQMFHRWCGSRPLYSFAKDDLVVLLKNCELSDVEFPFDSSKFFDIRETFSRFGIHAEDYSSSTIVKAFGKTITRSAHNALNDVLTIIDGLRELSKWVKKGT